MNLGFAPNVPTDTWTLRVFGQVEEPVELDWDGFLALAQQAETADFHCVTQWSRLENTWEGVAFNEVMKLVNPKPEATHVMVHCFGGYTTNLPLDDLMKANVLFAHKHNGEPLEAEHGGPCRLVVPHLYFWKSAKWVRGIQFVDQNNPGFWEQYGYHMRGDPWSEERYS
ncbi:MAG: sulfite oxidase-like oxidoreductase [Bacteroidetes bacterium]|nr:sulfite oxidase-like oxidoreductase [Bacteroidota bacterium]